jgi:hypothetical protein
MGYGIFTGLVSKNSAKLIFHWVSWIVANPNCYE